VSKVLAICPHCQKKYRVQFELVGRTTNCKQCQNPFEIIAADDSADSFGIPDAKDYLANQAFDPLSPARTAYEEDPAQTFDVPGRDDSVPNKVEARDWKSELRKSRLQSPFGPIQRTLLGLGILFILGSVAINLLHLFGVQLGEGNSGRFIGLAFGLIGAGLVGVSLMRFPASARIAGAAAALFVFLVFLASLINAKKREQPIAAPPTNNEEKETIASFNSPWIKEYPQWLGFDEMERMPSVSDRWNRNLIPDSPFSASFPGEPTGDSQRYRINRTNIPTRELVSEVDGFQFSLSAFDFPSQRGQSDSFKLNESEKHFGEIKLARSIEYDGCPGKEYKIVTSSKSTHGRFFLVGEKIVHIKLVGTSTQVPGVLSHEFLDSLQIREDRKRNDQAIPEFDLTSEQQAQQNDMIESARQVEELIALFIRSGGLMNFPNRYLSISAGKDAGSRRFLVHPGKLPILGVDLIEVRANRGSLIANLTPIYGEPTNEQSIMANQGYALAGLEVNSGKWIKGVRLVFMQVTPTGFNTSKAYRSKWYGTRASGPPEKLGGDGNPVYGLWMCRTNVLNSIGLIRENN